MDERPQPQPMRVVRRSALPIVWQVNKRPEDGGGPYPVDTSTFTLYILRNQDDDPRGNPSKALKVYSTGLGSIAVLGDPANGQLVQSRGADDFDDPVDFPTGKRRYYELWADPAGEVAAAGDWVVGNASSPSS